jgi:integrase
MYIEVRRRRYYALHAIPRPAQKALGKVRFVQSLETEDRATAERRAALLKVRWLADIRQAITGNSDHIERDALFWHKVLQETPEPERPVVLDAIADEAQAMVDNAGARAGIIDDRDPRYSELREHADAERFLAIATGKQVRMDAHLDEYAATLKNEAKTVDMKKSTITKFAGEFTYTGDVTRKAVQKWINKQIEDGKKASTVQRTMSELRGYWGYLGSIEAVPEDALPFDKIAIPKPPKNARGDDRAPFEADDMVKLWKAAKANKDQALADLIELAMWSGARIEELCALKTDKVARDHFDIQDAKTAAGWRKVPIHSKLKATVKRLSGASKGGYLLSGLTENKYGDRSNAIGKRFGHLKTDLGFTQAHVFHSIRKTVSTLLENAGVGENVAADILGHEKPRITYGLYSGGASMDTKRKAIEKLKYPA